MITLTIRSDKPEAEIGLYDDEKELAYETWQAHRELAETIHKKIEELLNKKDLGWNGIGAIVAYRGPGSFTGLRIGLAVANALAYGLTIPIVAEGGDDWQKRGIKKLLSGQNDKTALPEYGGAIHTTKPKK